MFLLTEGTLFFLDLVLSARACDEKPSLSSVVQKWADEVAAANDLDVSADGAHTTTGASSTLCAPPPVGQFATAGQTSPSNIASESTSKSAPILSKIWFPTDKDDRDDTMNHDSDASMSASAMISPGVGNSSYCHPDPDAPLPRWEPKGPRGVKRKVNDAEIISEAVSDGNEDASMDLEGADLGYANHSAKMTPVKIKSPMLPSKKKVKRGDASVPLVLAPPNTTLDYISALARMAQPHEPRRRRSDDEGYSIEVTKKSSEYTTKDLPVPCDQRWSQSFISTAILWYSVQKDIWHVPKAELASALQHIFDIVYPDVKYRVTLTGSVFALTLQRIYEWRNSFGSSALAMMLHFFSALDDADDVHVAAEFLATDFRFLRADPDTSEPTEPFRSPFLLILLAITHLGDISACVDVPGWDTRAMAAGEGGDGVIAIASAALERALTIFRDGTLDVDHILAETARCAEASVPRTVLDALAGHSAPPTLRFSSANWSGHTAAYRGAVRKRGAAFVRGTFDAAWAKRRRIVGNENEDGESGMGAPASEGVSVVPDPRALL